MTPGSGAASVLPSATTHLHAQSRRPGHAPRGPSVALVSTYPPTQCGLATFTRSLVDGLATTTASSAVVRVVDDAATAVVPGVVAHLVEGSAVALADVVRVLDSFDAVVLQHEYGIYGGPDGQDVLDLVDRVSAPLVVVLHTVLTDPTPHQRSILEHLLDRADVTVVMTGTARRRLLELYGADPGRTVVIPHGAADLVSRAARQRPTGTAPDRRPVVLTWGLLGPGKGIEWAIDALPQLRDLDPRYVVVGRTHPKVLEAHGEAYREGLVARSEALGVRDLLELDDRYLDDDQLAGLLREADVVLLPYDSVEQVTSGVLIEAVAAGKPVVSTAFPHAVELLADGVGIVVPQADPAALGAAVRRVLTDPSLERSMSDGARRAAPELLWSAVAARYAGLAAELSTAAQVTAS